MITSDLETLEAEINRAHEFASAGQHDLAVFAFDLARKMATEFADPEALTSNIQREHTGLGREREAYRKRIEGRKSSMSEKKLLVLGDSLALPRPNRMDTPEKGAETTYPWHLSAPDTPFHVTLVAQRYYSTDSAVAQLCNEPDLAHCDAAIIHLGLNDCANRMFLEHERLSLAILPEALREKIVTFAQRYRRNILMKLPKRTYVPLDRFRKNLGVITHLLQKGGCTKILLTTVLLPPSKFWQATPGLNGNFATYNHEIFAATDEVDVLAFDFDRLAWGGGLEQTVGPDGMHLSDAGHRLFASEAIKRLA